MGTKETEGLSTRMESLSAKMAKSLHGHDAGKVYVILKEDESFYYLVNGQEKDLKHPKKKNKKHLQVIKEVPAEVEELLTSEADDLKIKRAIKLYNSRK